MFGGINPEYTAIKKTNILATFSHYIIICFEQFAPHTVILYYIVIKFH